MKMLRHVGVYGLALKDNKILLISKIRGPYTGKLDLPGGRLEPDEKPIECIVANS